jgi:Mrp family chromosome partitioning ATPase
MSALDQAFIKAYSQHNPALAPAALESAEPTVAARNPAKNTVSSKAAKASPAKPAATKHSAKRKPKLPRNSASESIFAEIAQSGDAETPAKKAASAKKPAAKKAKKPTAPIPHHPPRAASNTEKKPILDSEIPSAAPASNGPGAANVLYRLDLPAATTSGGNSTSVRSTVPAPHTDAIFSEMESLLPQREPTPKQSPSQSTETPPVKTRSSEESESAPDKKTCAQDVPRESQLANSFSDGWTEDFKRAFSNLERTASTRGSSEQAPDREIAKTPPKAVESILPATGKLSAAAQVPLPEKKPLLASATKEKNGAMRDKPLAAEPPAPAIRLFQPMLQVDHFAWPKVCGRLEACANAELERVIETLIAAQIRGKKVFALGGCRAGDGASSLLMAAARRLAAQDLKVALVEADWSQPQLARRLGLLPQYGWEDVLSGRFPLEEVLIESIAERLVILPVREPFGASELPADAARRLTETWNSLRHHFDVVLVDPGPLCGAPLLDSQLVGAMAGGIDAVLMVKNLRRHDDAEFDAIGKALGDAGAKVVGVVENFAD